MNCNNCKFKGPTALGSSHHISCTIFQHICKDDSNQAKLLELGHAAGEFYVQYTDENGNKQPVVKLNEHGVVNGWCTWPINFDQIWVDDCKYYNDKDE